MKTLLISLITLLLAMPICVAQKFYTKNGYVSFFSKAPIENIKADNNQVICVLDTKTGQLQFSLLIKNFHFAKALMEEHFNENYMESNKYPKATFHGTIANIQNIDFNAAKGNAVNVSGELTMHGVSKRISATGSIITHGGIVMIRSAFHLKLADYNIAIPSILRNNISETQEITVFCYLNNKI